jgi:hypothetical protein
MTQVEPPPEEPMPAPPDDDEPMPAPPDPDEPEMSVTAPKKLGRKSSSE